MVPDSAVQNELSGEEMYVVVRKAVEDAILSILGKLVLAVMAFILVWFGMFVAVASYGSNPLQAVAGVFVVLVGLYFAATALDVIPPLNRWR